MSKVVSKTMIFQISTLAITTLILSTPYLKSTQNKPIPDFTPLTSSESTILDIAEGDGPGKLRNLSLIEKSSQEAKILNIKQCAVRPIVIKIHEGHELILNNLDKVDHKIESDRQHQYLIPANSTKTILVEFGHGPGLYSIICDQSAKISGIFLVVN